MFPPLPVLLVTLPIGLIPSSTGAPPLLNYASAYGLSPTLAPGMAF